MANTSSAKKAARQTEARTLVNKARKSRIRTFMRKVEDAILGKDSKKARKAFKDLEPELMRGVTKGVFKLNTAARKLRRLAISIRKVEGKPTKVAKVSQPAVKKEVKKTTTKVIKKVEAKMPVKKAETKKAATTKKA